MLHIFFRKKEKTLAIGVWPEVSLVEARKKRDEAKWKIVDGEIHCPNQGSVTGVLIINKDGSLTIIAMIIKINYIYMTYIHLYHIFRIFKINTLD